MSQLSQTGNNNTSTYLERWTVFVSRVFFIPKQSKLFQTRFLNLERGMCLLCNEPRLCIAPFDNVNVR